MRDTKMETNVLVLVSLLSVLLWTHSEARESELNYVTCGSLVKLLNTRHNVRLHSHDVKYGSGNLCPSHPPHIYLTSVHDHTSAELHTVRF